MGRGRGEWGGEGRGRGEWGEEGRGGEGRGGEGREHISVHTYARESLALTQTGMGC